ncbi:MAG: hypothetical protein GY923_15440 [Aestuariibacter sp.]|nr:hypothetical protein [Aestuariibacter sp.]
MNARCGAVLLMIDAMRRRGLTEFSFNVTGVGSANGKFSPDAPEAPELPPEEADEERRKDVERKRFGGSS